MDATQTNASLLDFGCLALLAIVAGIAGGCCRFYASHSDIRFETNIANSAVRFSGHKMMVSDLGTGAIAALIAPSVLVLANPNAFDHLVFFSKSGQVDLAAAFRFLSVCLIAAYFSPRFLDEAYQRLMERVVKQEQTVAKTQKEIASLDKNTAELRDAFENEGLKDDENINPDDKFNLATEFTDIRARSDGAAEIILSLFRPESAENPFNKRRFAYRTAIGISKEIDFNPIRVNSVLDEYVTKGIVKMKTSAKTGYLVYALTVNGVALARKLFVDGGMA